jgi:hypothetical protein
LRFHADRETGVSRRPVPKQEFGNEDEEFGNEDELILKLLKEWGTDS